jgi:hypothetical protein
MLDRLMATLQMHGIEIKRSKALEIMSAAFGYHNSNEFTAAAKRGDLNAEKTEIVDRIEVAQTSLAVIREESGNVYAIEESFLDQVVDGTSRESFGPSPYGGLNNIVDAQEKEPTRYSVYDGDFNLQGSYTAFKEAREGLEELKDHFILDAEEHSIYEWKTWYSKRELDRTKPILLAAALHIKNNKIDDLNNSVQSLINLSPDWRRWEKDLKKASSRSKGPISDEDLYRFRHAVADNTCKRSESERFTASYRVNKFIERHLGGLIARLDAAEEALAANQISVDYGKLTLKDAKTVEASVIEDMIARAETKKSNLWAVRATRDGDFCEETFEKISSEDPEDTGRRIAAKQFRMDLEVYECNGTYDEFDSECDTFEVYPLELPKEITMVTDVLVEWNRTSGLPLNNSMSLKLVAIRESLTPKPTIKVQ